MSIIKYYPLSTALGPLRAAETIFGDLFDHAHRASHSWWVGNAETGELAPSIEIVEKKDRFVLRAELPGVKKDDVELTVSHGLLNIAGEIKRETEEEEGTCYCSERAFGRFSRTVQLPDGIDEDAIEAVHKDGILEVCLPKREEAKTEVKKLKVA